ncbi:MAG: hypothetical protein PHW73_08875 [Atribacterota bacterium]|jgi:hypothetical protein|nr:hypothetical protein [Atribacterota bacterium]
MADKLESGKYYKWEGPTDDLFDGWAEPMKFMLDGNPHLCIKGLGNIGRFEEEGREWTWYGLNYMVECEPIGEKLNKNFKLRDKVKIIKNPIGAHSVGNIGFISKWNPYGPVKVKVGMEEQLYFPCELELIEKGKSK